MLGNVYVLGARKHHGFHNTSRIHVMFAHVGPSPIINFLDQYMYGVCVCTCFCMCGMHGALHLLRAVSRTLKSLAGTQCSKDITVSGVVIGKPTC